MTGTPSGGPADVLKRESLHSIRNTLHLLVSLFSLEKRRIQDPEAKRVFTETMSRVRAIALMYDKRLITGDLSTLSFGEYLRHAAAAMTEPLPGKSAIVTIRVDVEDVLLPLEEASGFALITHELLSEVLSKSASNGAAVTLSLRRTGQGEAVLRAGAQGTGQDKPRPSEIAQALAAQIGGSVVIEAAALSVRFPLPLEPKADAHA